MAELERAAEGPIEKLPFKEDYNTDTLKKEADCNAVVPSVGEEADCMEAQLAFCSFPTDLKLLHNKLHLVEKQLQYLLSKVATYQNHLIYSGDHAQNEAFARVVPKVLEICQPYFDYMESAARNTVSGQSLPMHIRIQLLQFSQQLCIQLEQLVLTYASYGYLSLAETDPLGISQYYIGQCQVENIKMSIFRYCQPTPFLALTSNELYKRMRWNVKRMTGTVGEVEKSERRTEGIQEMKIGQEANREKGMEGNNIEYYFLCHVDIHLVEGEALREQTERKPGEKTVLRMWSIGKWVQIYPDPDSEDIIDWVSTSHWCIWVRRSQLPVLPQTVC
ncbi:UPF0575 protein C19orf67 homolog isoform X2 [Silurus meridionalis]|uniref:UPF0575 protein C19orf67 homolog isoform X2 n=1 Tax=Silurus meridionalis TaxID=175797 RepID=UPI001EECE06A|nr:UPF0575 protein C19orf67 homolog isoform X2 [Silurus meridionalis]